MISQPLLDYIRSQVELGVGRDAIEQTLLAQGWKMSDITAGFDGVMQVEQVVSPPPSSFSRFSEFSENNPAEPADRSTLFPSYYSPSAQSPSSAAPESFSLQSSPEGPRRAGLLAGIVLVVLIFLGTGVVYSYSSGNGNMVKSLISFFAPEPPAGSVAQTPVSPIETSTPTISLNATPAMIASGQSSSVNWTTDVPATSQIEFGLTAAYGNSTVLGSGLAVSHSVALSELAADTLYHYRILSDDSSGDSIASPDQTFVTLPLAQSALPTVSISSDLYSAVPSAQFILAWDSSNAVSCSGAPWTSSTAVSGSQSLAETVTTTYSITCENSLGQTASQSVTVPIAPTMPPATSTPPVTPTQPSSVPPPVTITSPASGTVLTAGTAYTFTSTSASPLTNVTLTMTDTTVGQVVDSVTATIIAAQSTFAWTIPSSWTAGTYTLSAVSNGQPVTITNNSFSIAPATPAPPATPTPPVTPTPPASPPPAPTPTVTLTTDFNQIPYGYIPYFSWSSTNATACSATSGNFSTAGATTGQSYGIIQTAPVTYAISCSNGSGGPTATDSLTVTVIGNAPIPSSSPLANNESAILAMIAGRTPSGTKITSTAPFATQGNQAIFSTPEVPPVDYNPLVALPRNPSIFTGSTDLTFLPITYGNNPGGYNFNGALVAPDILITANHLVYGSPIDWTGLSVYFETKSGALISSTIVGGMNIVDSNGYPTDLYVMKLASPVGGPGTGITPADVFAPSAFSQWISPASISNSTFTPVIVTNRNNMLGVRNLVGYANGTSVGTNQADGVDQYDEGYNETYQLVPGSVPWTYYPVVGDSGSAEFMIINDTPVVLNVWTNPYSGTDISTYYTAINTAMKSLGSIYQLTPIGLSGFPTI